MKKNLYLFYCHSLILLSFIGSGCSKENTTKELTSLEANVAALPYLELNVE